ncbi:MAG: glycosyltransferase family 39 protein [Candidatus Aenigmarchaeota archaeon]|nr:glycosyltransferase family 39 protein [Candidatus Aenigmarchaeota archaeon]
MTETPPAPSPPTPSRGRKLRLPAFRKPALPKSGKAWAAILQKRWYVLAVLAIMVLAFYVRVQPAKWGELPGLDEFLFYRYSEYVLQHDLQFPEVDYMRHHPDGIRVGESEYVAPIYIPVYLYLFLQLIGIGMHFLTFVLIYPPLMGAFAVGAMFLLGREAYDLKAGLLAGFFLATEPAVIARTVAGVIEKEAAIAPFVVLVMFFFIRAYKRNSWVSGLLGGVCLAVIGMSSGITQFFYVIFAIYALALLILNRGTDRLVRSYLPLLLVGLLLPPLFVRHTTSILSTELPTVTFTLAITGLVLIRFLVGRFRLLKPEQLRYFSPALIGVAILAFLLSTLFVDASLNLVTNVVNILTLQQRDPTGFTVAENQPGNWGAILEASGARYAGGTLPQLVGLWWLASAWVYMLLAVLVGLTAVLARYPAFRRMETKVLLFLAWLVFAYITGTNNEYITATLVMSFAVLGAVLVAIATRGQPGKELLLFYIVWLATAVLSVFFQIRLLSLYGPIAALMAGVGLSYVITHLFRQKDGGRLKVIVRHLPIPLIAFFAIVISLNAASAYSYTANQGPAMCVINPDILINREKCVVIQADGSLQFAAGQPWYDAFKYMSTQTDPEANFLSWWDFGYWFQTRGLRNSVSDGGGGYRDQIARWFTADASQWGEVEEFLVRREVDYVLMDFTLPGKYGAITAIASEGQAIKGIPQFSQSQQFQQGGQTIIEFVSGPYALWIPSDGNQVTGVPMLLQAAGSQYAQLGFINELCTAADILRVGNETQTVGGCVAVTQAGVFYLPDDIKNTVFSRLMFMGGAGLPVQKVFDNALIQIFEVRYNTTDGRGTWWQRAAV